MTPEALMTPEEELSSRLYQTARDRAEMAGRHFGEGADTDLHELTRNGAAELLEIADEQQRLSAIRQAEEDIERLIEMAIKNAENIPGYPPDLLGEQSYFPALFRFCPCPPFCR